MRAQFDMERERSRELFKEVADDNADGRCRCNFHSQIELYIVREGQVDALVNQHRMLLGKDQMAVALSYDAHLFRSTGASESCIVTIPPELCREFTRAVRNKQVQNPFICDRETVREIRTYVAAAKQARDNELKLRGYLYVILGIVLENIFLEATDSTTDTELSGRLLFYLNRNFRSEITLQTLSAEFGYSPGYLSRYFRECVGVGVSRYVNILRLRNALLLLQEGKYTHTYCALESGFTSVRTFYRIFRQELQCAPGAYLGPGTF